MLKSSKSTYSLQGYRQSQLKKQVELRLLEKNKEIQNKQNDRIQNSIYLTSHQLKMRHKVILW